MIKMLELLDIVFKISMINVFKALNEKVDNMEAQMGNASREIETRN